MPGSTGVNVEGSCEALCRTLVSQNGLQRETTDISQSVLYTSLMGLLLVTDNEKDPPALGSGRVGLRNIGNTCFLNAVFQCLSHTRILRNYCLIKSYKHEKFSKEDSKLMEAFSQVMSGLWDVNEGDRVVNPRKFYSIFKEAVPYFSGYSQQDAQEFLRFLLDKLHTEINRRPYIRKTGKEPEQKYVRIRLSEEAAAMWKKHLDRDDSMIVDLFSGQLRSSLHCSVCSHYSNTLTSLDLGAYGPVDSGAVLYDLYAICNHAGTVNMGHYTACCLDENGWCFYNDSSVTPITENQLQTNQAYVLFYQRSNSTATVRK